MVENGPQTNLAESFPVTGPQTFKSLAETGGKLWDVVQKRLCDLGWSEEEAYNFGYAVHEVFVNAVKHGNKGDATKDVVVTCNLGKTVAEATVEDEGKGFNINQVADPLAGENLLKESGRGLFIIRNAKCEIGVSQGEKGCKVTLRKRREF